MSINHLNIPTKQTGDKLSANEFNQAKDKVNELVDGFNGLNYITGAKIGTNGEPLSKDSIGRVIIPEATSSSGGAMSASDKEKLDALPEIIDITTIDMVVDVTRLSGTNNVTTETSVSDVLHALAEGKNVIYRVRYRTGDPTVSYFLVANYSSMGSAVTSFEFGDGKYERLVHNTSGLTLYTTPIVSSVSINGETGTTNSGVVTIDIESNDIDLSTPITIGGSVKDNVQDALVGLNNKPTVETISNIEIDTIVNS